MMNVLLITQTPGVSRWVRSVLPRERLVVCRSPDDAQVGDETEEFDLLILDAAGLGSASQAVRQLRGRAVHLWVLLAAGQAEPPLDLLDAGADDWALGPPPSGVLEARLLQAAEQGRRKAELIRRCQRQPVTAELALANRIISSMDNLILIADERGAITYASPAVERTLGYSVSEVLGEGWWQVSRRSASEQRRERSYLAQAAEGARAVRTTCYESKLYDKAGRAHWILWQDSLGPDHTVIGIGYDITERRQLEEELRRVAIHDGLTGLYNRWHFDRALVQELQRANRYRRPLALLIVDLDGFKQVNDQLGHPKGDDVLREVARLLTDNLRNSDLVFRYGGDEFVVLLVETNGEAQSAIDRIQAAFEAWRDAYDLGEVLLGLSIGKVIWKPGMTPDPERLLRKADLHLYEEKRGKDVADLARALSKTSERLRSQSVFLNSIGEMIVATDQAGRVVYANQAFADWCGRPLQRLKGRVLKDDIPPFAPVVAQAEAAGGAPQKVRWCSPQGVYKTLLVTLLSELKSPRGTPFANVFLASDITELEKASERLLQKQRFLERLNAESRLESILQLILEEAVGMIPNADSGSARLLNEETGDSEFVASVGWDLEQLKQVRIPSTEDFHQVRYRGKPVIVSDEVQAFDRTHLDPKAHQKLQRMGYPLSTVSMPIELEGKMIGMFNINSRTRPDAFSQDDAVILQLLLPQLELAVKRAKERTALVEHQRRTRLAFQLGQELSRLDTVDALVRHTVHWAVARYGYDLVSIALKGDGHLRLVALSGSDQAAVFEGKRVPLTQGSLVAVAIQQGQPVRVDDVHEDPHYLEVDARTRSELVMPIVFNEDVIGALNLESFRPAAFGERDLELASFLAGQLAIAISNIQRGVALRHSESKFASIFHNASSAMALLGPDLEFLDVNQSFLQMFGYALCDLQQLTPLALTHPDDREQMSRSLSKIFAGERDSFHMEKRYVRKNGDVFWGFEAVSVVRDHGGKIRYLIPMVRDISEQKHNGQG